MKNLKNHQRRLSAVLQDIDIEPYNVSFTEGMVLIQAHFNSNVARQCRTHKYDVSIDLNGYVDFRKHNVLITLT